EEGYGLEGQPLLLVRYLRGVFSGVRIVVGEIPTILDERGRTTRPRVSDPRSRHERRGPIIAGQRWTGAGGNKAAHHVELEESGREPQRRRPNPALDECKVVAPASQASAFRRSGIRIGAVREKRLDKAHASPGIAVSRVAVTQAAPQHRGMQGRVTKRSVIGIRAGVQEKRRQRTVTAVSGGDENRIAVGRPVVDVSPRGNQELGRLEIAGPGRKQEWCAATQVDL